jgi:histidine triad (HIT) family protein
MADECIFCQIIAGRKPADIVYQTETIIAFRDIAPQAPTHILLVPRKHIVSIADLSAEDAPLMGDLMLAAKAVAEQEGISHGFRLVVNSGRPAGQSVFHLHFHLLGGRRMAWPPG